MSYGSNGFFETPECHSGILDRSVTMTSACIYGLGHLGSWVARGLSALGLRDLSLFDFDVVEDRNLSGSVYTRDDVGCLKTAALFEHLMDINTVNTSTIRQEKTVGYATPKQPAGFPFQPFSDFYILAVDGVPARRRIADTIFKQWNMCGHVKSMEDMNPVLIDTRSRGATLVVLNLPIRNREMQQRYFKDLEELDSEPGEVACNQANIIQVPFFVSSIVAQMVTSFLRGKEDYYYYQGSLLDLGRYPYRLETENYLPTL